MASLEATLAGGLAIVVLGFGTGFWVRDAIAKKHELSQLQDTQKQIAAAVAANKTAQVASNDIGTKVAEKQVEIQHDIQTKIVEIPKYITVHDDAECIIPLGFLRLHNAATNPGLPEPSDSAAKPNDTPTGLALSELASVDIANAGQCRAQSEQLNGLIDHVLSTEAQFKK